MLIHTKRLMIRSFTADDFGDFAVLIHDKMNSKFAAYDEQFPTDGEGIKNVLLYFAESEEFFAIEQKAEKRLIGFVSLNYVDETTRNLGYCIHSAFQGQGFGKEVVARMKCDAKEKLKVRKLVSGTAEENAASVRLLLGSGFRVADKKQVSFANDQNGKPIIFTGCSFECLL